MRDSLLTIHRCGSTVETFLCEFFFFLNSKIERERQRQTETETERQRQTERDRETETDRERETEANRETDRETETDRERVGEVGMGKVRSEFSVYLLNFSLFATSLMELPFRGTRKVLFT